MGSRECDDRTQGKADARIGCTEPQQDSFDGMHNTSCYPSSADSAFTLTVLLLILVRFQRLLFGRGITRR